MNYSLITLEILAVLLGLTVLLADLWVSPSSRKALGLGLPVGLCRGIAGSAVWVGLFRLVRGR